MKVKCCAPGSMARAIKPTTNPTMMDQIMCSIDLFLSGHSRRSPSQKSIRPKAKMPPILIGQRWSRCRITAGLSKLRLLPQSL